MEEKKGGKKEKRKEKRLIKIVATTSLRAVDRPLERRPLVPIRKGFLFLEIPMIHFNLNNTS